MVVIYKGLPVKEKTYSKQKLIKKSALRKQFPTTKKPKDKIKKSINSPQAQKTRKSFFEDEQSFRELFENMSSCVAVYTASANGKDFVLKDFNKSAEKAEKIDRKKIIGKSVSQVFPGVKDLGLFKVFQRVWKTGKPEHHPTNFYKDNRIQGWKENYVYKLPTGEIVAIYDDVSERKQTENDLKESESRCRNIIEQSKDGIIFFDGKTRKIIFGNGTMAKMLGCSKEDLVGRSIPSLHPSEEWKSIEQEFQKHVSGKTSISTGIPVRRDDGSVFYADISSSLITLEGKTYFSASFRDITERKQAQKKLQQSEEKYRLTFASTSDVIFTMDSELKVSTITPSVEKILGYKPEELINKFFPDLNLMTPESLGRAIPDVRRVLSGAEVPNVVYNFITKEGLTRTGEVTGSPIVQEGKIIGVSCVARDITERKRAEEELKESENKYRLLADNANDVIFVLDMNLNYTYISPSVKILRGYEPAEVLKKPTIETLTPSSWDLAMRNVSEVMELEKSGRKEIPISRTLQLEMVRKDGTTVWTEVAFSFIRDEDQRPVGILGVARDISERKLAEEKLRKSEESFRLSLDDSPLGVRIVTAEGETLYANQATLEIYSYDSIEELRKTPQKESYTPESYAEFQTRKEKRERGEFGSSEYEISIVRKNGEIRHIQVFRKEVWWNGARQFQVVYQDITKRKNTEDELHKSEQKYRTILENIEDGYYEVDLNGNFTFFNDSMCRIMGYPQEEMVGMNNRQYTDAENAKKLFQAFNGVYRTGEPAKEFNWQIIRKDGTNRYIETSISLLKNSSGKPTGFKGIVRDITERKRAEEKLQESEKYFKEITENSSDIIIITDKNGDLKYCSRSIERFTGYKPEELIGRSALTLIHPDDKKRAVGDFGKAILTTDSAIPNAFRIVHKDGSERYFEGLGKNLFDNPAVAGFIMNVRDATERKQAEEKLQRSEEKYRNILENMQEGYFEIDLAGNFTFVNDAQCKITGTPREQLLGKNNRDYANEKEAKRLYQIYSRIYRTGEPVKGYAFEFTRRDGTKAFHEVSASLIRDSRGKPIGFRGVSRDITERKQAEETLHQSEEKYRNIIEEMGDGYYETDLAGNFTFFNDSLCKIHGYPRKELMGMNDKQYADEENAKKVFKFFNKIYRTGESGKIFDNEIIRKDGTKRQIEVSGSLKKDSLGNPTGFKGITRDITERKQAEEELRQSEEKYRNILENMQEGYFELDLAGNFTFVNDAECRNIGYPREELIGMNNRQYQDKTKAREMYQLFKRLYRTGEPIKALDVETIKKNGTKHFDEVSVSLIRDAEGKPIGFRGISRDVTERKQAEEKLLQSETKYRSLIENAQEGIYQSTVGYLTLNPALARMLGYDSPEEVMATITDIAKQLYVNPDDRKKLLEIVNEKGSVTDFETEYYKKDGSRIWISINMHAIRDDQGRILYYQGIDQDITEKKKMEAERQENIERLRKSLGATINAMAVTVETRDPYTAGHQRRVADLARAIATEMNLTGDQIDGIRMASTIHDIGKISIPSEILTKPTQLTDLEFNLIKIHPQSGYNILKDIEFPWPIARIILEHHERINGSGYPNGLKGEQILLESRILAIADVVEAISSHRPYRPAHGINVAFDEISKNKGILYDPAPVDACLRLFREKNYKMAA